MNGKICLWASIVLFASSNSLVRLISDIGESMPVEGRNPISFCNILFAGNLISLPFLVYFHRRDLKPVTLKRTTAFHLVFSSLLAGALAPALLFTALENTTVTNVVLIGRIEAPLVLLFSLLVLSEKPQRKFIIGHALSLLGVLLAFSLSASNPGSGEVYSLIASIVLAYSTTTSKLILDKVPMGFYIVLRTVLGTVAFFITTVYLYGDEHFMDIFEPVLWKWMLVYGPLIVVLGQTLWFAALRQVSGKEASFATSVTPFIAIAFAAVILGELPEIPVVLALFFIGVGVSVMAFKSRKPIELDAELGFKGI